MSIQLRRRRIATLIALSVRLTTSVVMAQQNASRSRNTAAQTPPIEPFARLVADLSEPGGYFDTDNLISNEKSYLQVIGELERRNTTGGVYIGVGPDQNFSYIARTRPKTAFILDIRRDNLLLQLLFKAIFELAPTRVEYL